jgi:23S rRNA (cytidine1920-2'-O)/16S rRNA (cytidine1409-2'-O)-methyltransferase
MKTRLDKLLVERGLAETREKAQALILAGLVRVNGAPAAKAGAQVAAGADIEVTGHEHPYVSRGGVKLEAALREFGLDPSGWRCLDIGASTGGFTDCLLQHGAARVFAVDVGYGQLAWRLRQDPRVTAIERTNIRTLDPAAIGPPAHLIVMDVSFISLRLVLRNAVRFLAPGGFVLALVKPQFEAGREQVGKGGRVTDPAIHRQVLDEVEREGEALGLKPRGRMVSPLPGKKSANVEFFLLWALEGGARSEARAAAEPSPEAGQTDRS